MAVSAAASAAQNVKIGNLDTLEMQFMREKYDYMRKIVLFFIELVVLYWALRVESSLYSNAELT